MMSEVVYDLVKNFGSDEVNMMGDDIHGQRYVDIKFANPLNANYSMAVRAVTGGEGKPSCRTVGTMTANGITTVRIAPAGVVFKVD